MSSKEQNKVAVFEELKPKDRWLIYAYRFFGYDICFLRPNQGIVNKKWFVNFLENKFIEKINPQPVLGEISFSGFHTDVAYNNIDLIYNYLANNRLTISKVVLLYQNKNIELAYKRGIIQRLSRFYYLNRVLNEINQHSFPAKVIFIPSNGIDSYRTDSCEIYDYRRFYKIAQLSGAKQYGCHVDNFPIWAALLSYSNAGKRKCKTWIKITGFFFWMYLKWAISLTKHFAAKRCYKYAIMITAPRRQFANPIQKVDFLIDGNLIKKEDTIFLAYKKLKKKEKKYLAVNELNYLANIDSFITLKQIKQVLPVYLFLINSTLRENSFILETTLKMLYFYLRWESLINNIKIESLITYCDVGFQSIARNIILEQHACKSYYYMDSAHFGCFSTKRDSKNKYRFFWIGFLYGDYFISWNDEVSEYFRNSNCRFKNYKNLGCFWAEHVRLICQQRIKSDFKKRLSNEGYTEKMKLISVFDMGFHDDSTVPYEDGIKFLEDVLKLLDDLPDIFLVLKEKKARKVHQGLTGKFREIEAVYDKLDKHPRCFYIKGGEGRWKNASEVIAWSDLTISFPFVSTTFESLAARKRAIWYDAADKFRNTFYDQIPGIICHNYIELLNNSRKLLWEISDQAYSSYLDKQIKGKVESYLDGRAITRFRELISVKNNRASQNS